MAGLGESLKGIEVVDRVAWILIGIRAQGEEQGGAQAEG